MPCEDEDQCEELKSVQSECDHDWEYHNGIKICTYPECSLELPTDNQQGE